MRKVLLVFLCLALLATAGCAPYNDKYWTLMLSKDAYGNNMDTWAPLMVLFGIGFLPIAFDFAIIPITYPHDAYVMMTDEYDIRALPARDTEYLLCPKCDARAALNLLTCPIDGTPLQGGQTLVVATDGSGDYSTLGAAIDAALPGARIRVRPGTYAESITISKALAIVGDGSREQVQIESRGATTVTVTGAAGQDVTLSGLTLRAFKGSADGCFAVLNDGGRLLLENCDVSSDSWSNVIVNGSPAEITARHVFSQKSGQVGFFILGGARGLLESCEMVGCVQYGLLVRGSRDVVVRDCKVMDSLAYGVYVEENGALVMEDSEMASNQYANIRVDGQGCTATLRRVKLHDSREGGGIWVSSQVSQGGSCVAEDCEVYRNRYPGIQADAGCSATVRRTKVYGNSAQGIVFATGSSGVVEDCDIYENASGAFSIASGASVVRNRNQER